MPRFFDISRNRAPLLISFLILIALVVIVAFTSIYGINRLLRMSNDAKNTLLPAVITTEIAEYLTENRLYIEEHIVSENNQDYPKLEAAVYVNYQRIDSLFVKYNDEYTLREATNQIVKYRTQWRNYKQLEQKVLALSRKGTKKDAQKLFLGQSITVFQELVHVVGALTNQHVANSETKYAETQTAANYIKFVVYTSIGISFLVVVILGIFMGVNFYQ